MLKIIICYLQKDEGDKIARDILDQVNEITPLEQHQYTLEVEKSKQMAIFLIFTITFINNQKQPPRQFFKITVTCIFQESLSVRRTDMFFLEGPIIMFFKQTHIFQEGLSKQTCFFKEGLSVCQTDHIISSNTYKFSRSLYFLIEQIFIFQEALSSPRTHIIFQETPMPQTDRHFPGRYPRRTDISLMWWLLLYILS